jgi:hypothetical protein
MPFSSAFCFFAFSYHILHLVDIPGLQAYPPSQFVGVVTNNRTIFEAIVHITSGRHVEYYISNEYASASVWATGT